MNPFMQRSQVVSDFIPLQNTQLQAAQATLAGLKDITVPDSVTWWPLADTIWALMIGVFGVAIGLAWFYWTRHKNNRYRREALQKLKFILSKDLSPQETILEINQLLKQVAITHYGRSRVSPLLGKSWVKFLQDTITYVEQPKNLLETLQSSYQPNHSDYNKDLEGFLTYSKAWIRGHHK